MSDRREDKPESGNQTAYNNIQVGRDFHAGDTYQSITTVHTESFSKKELKERAEKSSIRQTLLKKVKGEVEAKIKELPSTLCEGKPIDIHKEIRPGLIVSKKLEQKRETLPLNMEMTEIFLGKAKNELLILGIPGVGKTFALFQLAQGLLDRAERAEEEPIPVLLNISTWKFNQTISQWIISEFKDNYQANKEVSRGLIDRHQLIFLMDELDLLHADDQKAFIQKINDWLSEDDKLGFQGLAVCSRFQEYNWLEKKFEFNNGAAVYLEPLRKEQISRALSRAENCQDLWRIIQEDLDLLNFAKRPLFLTILNSLATERRQEIFEKFKQYKTDKKRQEYLLKTYIENKLKSGSKSKVYPQKSPSPEETKRWLTQIAKVLRVKKEKSSTIFLIEKIQPPVWLSKDEQRYYDLAVRLTIGSIAGLSAGLYLVGWTNELPLLVFAILCGVVIGYISHKLSTRLDRLLKAYSRSMSVILYGLLFTIGTYGLGCATQIPLDNWHPLFLLTGIGVGIVFYFLVPQEIEPADDVEFSFNRAIKFASIAFVLGLIFVVLRFIFQGGLYYNFRYHLYELFSFVLVGLLFGSMFGKEVKIGLKKHPNQGIWKRWHHAMISFAVGAFISATFTILIDKSEAFRTLGIALTVGLWASLIAQNKSGIVCLQHVIIRFFLYRKGCSPWNYARFLDYATERGFLQKIGGRYRFWHDLLREYFAK